MTMWLLQVLVLLPLINSALASVGAGPYEALFFYYSYKMEYEAAPDDELQRYLVFDCSNYYQRMCTFNEFLKYAYAGKLGGYGVDVTNNGPFNPDDTTIYPQGPNDRATLDRMASDLSSEGFVGASFSTERLYYGASPGSFYRDIIQSVTDRVQFARRANVVSYVDGIVNALTGIISERKADDMPSYIDSIISEVRATNGLDLATKTVTSRSGRQYVDVDWFETSNRIHDFSKPLSDLTDTLTGVQNTINTYLTSKSSHYRIYTGVENQLERVHKDPTC